MNLQDSLQSFVREELLFLSSDEHLDQHTNLISMGLDSLKMMRLIAFIEETFELSIPDEKVNPRTFNTLKNIAELIESSKISRQ